MKPVTGETGFETGFERYQKVWQEAPDNSIVTLALAEASLRHGLQLKALEAYARLRQDGIPEVHLGLAQIYGQLGMQQEAYKELRCLFQLEPGHPEGHILALQLGAALTLPADIQACLAVTPSSQKLADTRRRLRLSEARLQRDLDNWNRRPRIPINCYHLAETSKRLIQVQSTLAALSTLCHRLATAKTEVKATLDPLLQTRGVEGVMVGKIGGPVLFEHPVHLGNSGDFIERVLTMLHTVTACGSGSPELHSWVLEGAGGILFLRCLDPHHFILVTAHNGAVLQLVKKSIDKVEPYLCRALQS